MDCVFSITLRNNIDLLKIRETFCLQLLKKIPIEVLTNRQTSRLCTGQHITGCWMFVVKDKSNYTRYTKGSTQFVCRIGVRGTNQGNVKIFIKKCGQYEMHRMSSLLRDVNSLYADFIVKTFKD